jgi:hypothetical protein
LVLKLRCIILGLLIFVIGLLLGWWLHDFLAVDSCLDAGGRWQKVGGYCEGLSDRPG